MKNFHREKINLIFFRGTLIPQYFEVLQFSPLSQRVFDELPYDQAESSKLAVLSFIGYPEHHKITSSPSSPCAEVASCPS